jgi:chitin synthase
MDPFGHSIGKYIFVVLRYACVLIICVQFILSMGNRPQGSPRMYFTSMVIYSIIMAYTTFCALYIVVTQLKSPDTSIVLGNNVFTNLIVSTASTVGIYFIMSFLYLDPWHMFTSSAQYFALLPSYICTLQVYAFCNAHDVSWGTKGDNVTRTDLGTATGKGNDSNVVELEMPDQQGDIDTCYDEALCNLRDGKEVPVEEISQTQRDEDYYRAFRTYMVVIWLVANAMLAMAISEAYSAENAADNAYLKFILWSVAVVALFRGIGSTTFAVMSIVHSVAEGKEKWSSKWEESSWGTMLGSSSSGASGGRIGPDGNTVVSSHRSKLKGPSTFRMPSVKMPTLNKPMWMSNAGGWMRSKVPKM